MSDTGFNQDDRDKLNSIVRGLYGDPANGQEGIVHKVDRHEKWIEKADRRVGMIAGICVGLGLIAKEGLAFIVSFFHQNPKP